MAALVAQLLGIVHRKFSQEICLTFFLSFSRKFLSPSLLDTWSGITNLWKHGFSVLTFCSSLNLWSTTGMIKSWSIFNFFWSSRVDNTRWKKSNPMLIFLSGNRSLHKLEKSILCLKACQCHTIDHIQLLFWHKKITAVHGRISLCVFAWLQMPK